MSNFIIHTAVISFLLALPAFGEIYRCVNENGKTIISNTPCPEGSKDPINDQSHAEDKGRLAKKPVQEVSKEPLKIEEEHFDRQPSDELITACMNKYRDRLKDPMSPYVYKATIKRNKLYLDARAKNSFGGYVPGTFACPLQGENSIDEEALKLYLAAFQFGITLKD